MKYNNKDIYDFKMINKDTKETLFEGKIPMCEECEAISMMHGVKENLIPLTMKLDDNFEMKLFVTKETYKKLQEYNDKINM